MDAQNEWENRFFGVGNEVDIDGITLNFTQIRPATVCECNFVIPISSELHTSFVWQFYELHKSDSDYSFASCVGMRTAQSSHLTQGQIRCWSSFLTFILWQRAIEHKNNWPTNISVACLSPHTCHSNTFEFKWLRFNSFERVSLSRRVS